jgi:3-oxoacyl-[acyl-carrier-protein] synthase I
MSAPLAIVNTGLISAVGLSAPAACAAIRAGIANSSESSFVNAAGERIVAHQVPFEHPWRGLAKLAKMAAAAIEEALRQIPRKEWQRIPLVLCVAEQDRPGRLAGLEEDLLPEIFAELRGEPAAQSAIVPHGRTGIGRALAYARDLLANPGVERVLVAATDSYLTAETLREYDRRGRLLTSKNSNGFIPGEGAAALLVEPTAAATQLRCNGVGFATEPAHIESEDPLRAEGLVRAVRNALGDAGCAMGDLDFRITDISGEHYYFKEAAHALSRLLKVRKEEFDLWHPAQCIGETGAVIGVASIVVLHAACHKGYVPGSNILFHAGNDSGERTALILKFGAA